jgi:hypothetical protein
LGLVVAGLGARLALGDGKRADVGAAQSSQFGYDPIYPIADQPPGLPIGAHRNTVLGAQLNRPLAKFFNFVCHFESVLSLSPAARTLTVIYYEYFTMVEW